MRRWIQAWKQYKYRFVPWLFVNLRNRSLRTVTKQDTDFLLTNSEFQDSVLTFLSALHNFKTSHYVKDKMFSHTEVLSFMHDTLGFSIDRRESVLQHGGKGVRVVSGSIPCGSVTSLYPGLVYEPYEPIFFQSIKNSFIFRCADRKLIDGNDRGLSKILYRSCRNRDGIWPYPLCDDSWLSPEPLCPWNIGQYVNNQSKKYSANVVYQEYEIPQFFPSEMRQYLPNTHYSSNFDDVPRLLRVVALVALRDIKCGEELFSSYFTLVS